MATDDQPTDDLLMAAYAGGDADAFGELFRRHAGGVERVIRRTVRDPGDVEDLVQQVFLQVHRARKDYRSENKFRQWLFTIALNARREYFRRRARRGIDVPLDEEHEPTTKIAGPEQVADARRIRLAVAQLPDSQREVVELHWFEDLALADVAAIVGTSHGAAKVRAHRAYARLREMLGEVTDPVGPPSTNSETDDE